MQIKNKMKKYLLLLAFLSVAIASMTAESIITPTSKKVELQSKEGKRYKPRSVVSPVVQCWFDNGYLVFIVDEDESIETIKLTELSTGNVTLENIASGTRQYAMYIGASSVNIEVTLADGSEYEGMFVQ